MPPRVAILISGGGSNMVSLVKAMQSEKVDAETCLVLSNIPSAGGLEKAAKLGVQTCVIDHKAFGTDREKFEAAISDALNAARVDVICLAGFMRILTPSFIKQWENKVLNIHPSLLPKYKGLHTHQRALEAGDTQAGCTVHLVTAELDDGPIIGQRTVPIEPQDTPETLAARVLAQEHLLYPEALQAYLIGTKYNN